MAKTARDVMTSRPACCTPETSLEQVARLMVQHDCGEIPVIDSDELVVGVVTDRDIVCRMVAQGKNPLEYTAELCMSDPVVTVFETTTIVEALATMEKHQVRRLPVVDDKGRCVGMISQSDLAWTGGEHQVAELVREISRDTGETSR
ncbi:MAG: CBS domain-containing protein [Acidobacteriota bacterium]